MQRLPHPFVLALVWGFLAAVSGTVVSTTSASAECINTSIAEKSAAFVAPASSAGPWILGVQVDGEDVVVTLESGAPFTGTLDWIDAAGQVHGTGTVSLVPGAPWAVPLVDALSAVPQFGFQFFVRLVDGGGQPVAQVPLRVDLDCPAGGPCGWTAKAGLFSDGPVTEERLMVALDDARAVGAPDLFGYVLDHHPDLEGLVYGLAMQLEFLSQGSEPVDDGESCQCQWVSSWADSPSVMVGSAQGTPPVHATGQWYDGVRGYFAGQTLGGAVLEPNLSRFIDTHMRLFCTQTIGQQSVAVAIGARQPADVNVPTSEPCEPPCMGNFDTYGHSYLCMRAKGFGEKKNPTVIDLGLETSFVVDGAPAFDNPLYVQINTSSPQGFQKVVEGNQGSTTGTTGHRLDTELDLRGHVYLAAQRTQSNSVAYAIAGLRSDYSIDIRGTAACAWPQTQTLEFSNGGSGGGTLLEGWGDPP